MPHHKAGRLKQSNKKHKVPGSTKGSKDPRVQGRVAGAPRAAGAGRKKTNATAG